ncbi:MAG: VWA domain-containing protein [Bacteroidetes bacterium]|nr:VWA domain-containing protein [Bacteroidota bacterium]MBI3483251.1 VWA domain-containing protein [Bacteroidota bacterium]
MKTKNTSTKNFVGPYSIIIVALILFASQLVAQPHYIKDPPGDNQSIMLALLLDTSNSMDGLIDQAKSQLWKIVNELAAAKCYDGKKPNIRIALYEYGNDGLPSSEGYIRQVSGLTTDLDLISEKLFSMTTNGGNEFCGMVIKKSLTQLDWSSSHSDLKLIFIAGNEPFTQGSVSYNLACGLAKEKGVIVNTIFCGNFDEGISTSWKNGADLTGGTYMSIEQNRKTVFVPTPYDARISALNDQMNNTYIYYGKSGVSKKEMQSRQDRNAESYGLSNKVDRAVSKSSHAYQNSSWDLVDASKNDDKAIANAEAEELPAEMKGMSIPQRKEYVKQKSDERAKIQEEIQSLNKQRQEYINSHTPQESQDAMLDAAMIKAIKEQAAGKRFIWK